MNLTVPPSGLPQPPQSGKTTAPASAPVANEVLPGPVAAALPADQLTLAATGAARPLAFVDAAPSASAAARAFLAKAAQRDPAVMKPGPHGEAEAPAVYQPDQSKKRPPFTNAHDNTYGYVIETLRDWHHTDAPLDLHKGLSIFDKHREHVHLDELTQRPYKGGPIFFAPYHRSDVACTLAVDSVFREAMHQADPKRVAAAEKDLSRWLGLRSVIVTQDDQQRALGKLQELPPREFFHVLHKSDYELTHDLMAGKIAPELLEQKTQALVKELAIPGFEAKNLSQYLEHYWQPLQQSP